MMNLRLIAALLGLVGLLALTGYAYHKGVLNCKNAELVTIVKGVQQDEKTERAVGKMPVSSLDRALSYWLRD